MGVPAMFRWLSQKYPKIVSRVIEDHAKEVDGQVIPVDYTKPNPNGEEFDNLYLDMNGIVHPCTHPEDAPAPKNEVEMMEAIFKYTERVVGMVRPRKLLYLAVDGVAPRAKMNQQRSRRFRAAKEAKEKDVDKAEFAKMLRAQQISRGEDVTVNDDDTAEKTWDSNAITPGTPFMHLLAKSLQYWCAKKLNTDPAWANMKVIISDASVPGEGEHKIMNFIRSQRAMPTHDPNTRHVIYGLDADLIMLGLATHEPHFKVLREDVFYDAKKDKGCSKCGRKDHNTQICPYPDNAEKVDEDDLDQPSGKPFIWLHVNALREYLIAEMDAPGRRFTYDQERALDDWVFMCFFVGNDFLPHLPSLDIRDKGIDLLLEIWRNLVPTMDDYITLNGYPDMKRVQQIMEGLARQEAGIFKKRKEENDRRDKRQAERENGNKRGRYDHNGNSGPPFKRVKEDTSTYLNAGIPFFSPQDAQSKEVRNVHQDMIASRGQSNKSAAAQLKAIMKAKAEGSANASQEDGSASAADTAVSLGKRKADAIEDSDSGTPGRNTPIPHSSSDQEKKMPEDTIKLWEDGYEERYYEQKFHVQPDDMEFRHKVARAYAEGLCWVLRYYMQGCPSWTWYYPYHYAPFAADFKDIDKMKVKFKRGNVFKPYEQLMGVLPAASNHAIPEPFRILMSDPDSPIVDFYPEDFPIDLNGKKFAWQGVAILPFIDEKRLLDAMNTKYPELSALEHQRNETGKEILMFSSEHKLTAAIEDSFYSRKAGDVTVLALDPNDSDALHGHVEPFPGYVPNSVLLPPWEEFDEFAHQAVNMDKIAEDIYDNATRVAYVMPHVDSKNAHKSVLLDGVILPPRVVSDEEARNVRNYRSRGFNGRGRGDGRGRGGGRGGPQGSFNRSYNNNNNGGYNNNNYSNDMPPSFPYGDPRAVPNFNPQMGSAPRWEGPPGVNQRSGLNGMPSPAEILAAPPSWGPPQYAPGTGGYGGNGGDNYRPNDHSGSYTQRGYNGNAGPPARYGGQADHGGGGVGGYGGSYQNSNQGYQGRQNSGSYGRGGGNGGNGGRGSYGSNQRYQGRGGRGKNY